MLVKLCSKYLVDADSFNYYAVMFWNQVLLKFVLVKFVLHSNTNMVEQKTSKKTMCWEQGYPVSIIDFTYNIWKE